MTRVAIYARYSTDLQSQSSIEDQIRLCEERAGKEGLTVLQSYTDHAVSGASLMRPGIQMLMQDAAQGAFDTVYAEALDRISRDQEDIAAVYKRLTFAGIKLVTLSEGEIEQIHIGLKSTMNALFLKDLADKTRRGLRGRVEKGRSGGGKCFGYDVVPGDEKGLRVVNDVQASVVRRIFDDYASGKSPKAIAKALNQEGVPGPTGKAWGQSTINGNRQRGTGILNNELYIGRMVWNKLRYLKDPATGKRVSRMNPEEEWIVQELPELRIIEDGTWKKVRERQAGLSKTQALWQTNRPRNLFSYLIECSVCGGGCSTVSKGRIGCSNARNKGTCSNRQTIKRDVLEETVLGSLREHLMDDDLCKQFCDEYARHLKHLTDQHNSSLGTFKSELAALEREKAEIMKSIRNGVPAEFVKDDAIRVHERMTKLQALLEDKTEKPLIFEPAMASRYRQEVAALIESLNDENHREEASELVRALVDRIVLTPDEQTGQPQIDLIGDLAGILSIASKRNKSSLNEDLLNFHPDECEALVAGGRSKRLSPETSDQCKALVAGRGFEPLTFRL